MSVAALAQQNNANPSRRSSPFSVKLRFMVNLAAQHLAPARSAGTVPAAVQDQSLGAGGAPRICPSTSGGSPSRAER